MKKIALLGALLAVVLLAVGVGVIAWRRLAPPTVQPDALLPGGTLLLVEAVDLPRSALRWQKTDLKKIWDEPEVQTFFEKPLATFPPFQQAGDLRKRLVKLWPRQVFAAVVSMDGTTPKMIGGFSFAGDGKAADPWLAEARGKLKSAHPAGQAELILHGKIEVEIYTDQEFVLAEATHAGWRLAANDLALLKSTLDLLDAPKETRAPGLAADADYQRTFAAVPADAELRIFARTGAFVDRLQAAAAAGDPTKTTGLEALGKVRALAAVSKIEGGQFHDAVFSLGNAAEKPEPLERGALALTDPETTGFYSLRTSAFGVSALPPELMGTLPFLPALDGALTAQKATLADLPEIFGPELSLIIPKLQGPLSATLAIGLRDPQRAAALATALTQPALGENAWTASDEDGLKVYTAPGSGGLISVAPVLTVTEHYWLIGRSPASLAALVARDAATPQLDHTEAWRDLASSVVAPTNSFGYFNLASLFESYYATLRPLIALGLVGSEDLGQYVDAGRLPNASVVTRHLSGLVFSEATVPGGCLWEARGSVSVGQAILGGAAAYLGSGAEMPALPGLPGAATPAPGREK